MWGMLSFGIAHLLYISAFGMKPLNPVAGLVCGTAATIAALILYQGCDGKLNLFDIYLMQGCPSGGGAFADNWKLL